MSLSNDGRVMPSAASPPRPIVDIVLAFERGGPHPVVAVAGVVGLGLCALLGLRALHIDGRGRLASLSAVRVPIQVALSETVSAVSQPPFPRTRSQLGPTARRPVVPQASRRPERHASKVEPAAAATVLAETPQPSLPADLTSETFVVGAAKQYGGGATSARPSGTGQRGVWAALSVAQGTAGAPGQAAPVGLGSETWSCPWPKEADVLSINEETAVIRVVVRAEGSPESVTIVSDPGHGFGEAAAVCARQMHFVPARAPDGEPVRSASAPIRVRFTR